MRTFGIDEAGRGPVLGPLCLAGVLTINTEERRYLETLGCMDSKKYGTGSKAIEARARIAKDIRKNLFYREYAISSVEVDEAVSKKGLNRLERSFAEKILDSAKYDIAHADGSNIFGILNRPNVNARNKADTLYIEVSAASILAKDLRDRLFKELMDEYELPYGGWGYPNFATKRTLEKFMQSYGRLPHFYRNSYKWLNKRTVS